MDEPRGHCVSWNKSDLEGQKTMSSLWNLMQLALQKQRVEQWWPEAEKDSEKTRIERGQ